MRGTWGRGRRMLAAALLAAGLQAAPAAAGWDQRDNAALIRSIVPSVVNITARAEIAAPKPATEEAGETEQASLVRVNAGSGFVIDPSGLIITNWHVVDAAFEIIVTLSDGSRFPAEIAAAARVVDLALLRVKVDHPLPAIRWGDSSKVQVGDPVLAVGNALGVGLSVSGGIVSALNRNIGDTPVDDFIQTDAAINHGNSGGPLFNADGEVIGVNTALISPTAANAGLGFAMPSNDVRFVVDNLMRPGGYARPGWLGVTLQPVTPELAEASGFPDTDGSIVAGILDPSPAMAAGLQPGDVILTVNGEAPSDERSLLRLTTVMRPGTVVTLGIRRVAQRMEVKVTLGSWPRMLWERNAAPPPQATAHRKIPANLGLSVVPLPDDLRAQCGVQRKTGGVLITAIAAHTDAARRGLVPGDIFLQMGRTDIATQNDLQAAIDRARAEGHRYGAFLMVPGKPPESPMKFPGPKWVTLEIDHE